jgi:hypothetical protein
VQSVPLFTTPADAGDLPARERRGRLINGEVIRVDGERVGRYRLMLHLHGLGHFHPENEISNAFLKSSTRDHRQ